MAWPAARKQREMSDSGHRTDLEQARAWRDEIEARLQVVDERIARLEALLALRMLGEEEAK